jgi:hypothetical protein
MNCQDSSERGCNKKGSPAVSHGNSRAPQFYILASGLLASGFLLISRRPSQRRGKKRVFGEADDCPLRVILVLFTIHPKAKDLVNQSDKNAAAEVVGLLKRDGN